MHRMQRERLREIERELAGGKTTHTYVVWYLTNDRILFGANECRERGVRCARGEVVVTQHSDQFLGGSGQTKRILVLICVGSSSFPLSIILLTYF